MRLDIIETSHTCSHFIRPSLQSVTVRNVLQALLPGITFTSYSSLDTGYYATYLLNQYMENYLRILVLARLGCLTPN